MVNILHKHTTMRRQGGGAWRTGRFAGMALAMILAGLTAKASQFAPAPPTNEATEASIDVGNFADLKKALENVADRITINIVADFDIIHDTGIDGEGKKSIVIHGNRHTITVTGGSSYYAALNVEKVASLSVDKLYLTYKSGKTVIGLGCAGRDVYINACVFDGFEEGISCWDVENMVVENSVFCNGRSSGTSDSYGIDITIAESFIIRGCTFVNLDGAIGDNLGSARFKCRFMGCVFAGIANPEMLSTKTVEYKSLGFNYYQTSKAASQIIKSLGKDDKVSDRSPLRSGSYFSDRARVPELNVAAIHSFTSRADIFGIERAEHANKYSGALSNTVSLSIAAPKDGPVKHDDGSLTLPDGYTPKLTVINALHEFPVKVTVSDAAFVDSMRWKVKPNLSDNYYGLYQLADLDEDGMVTFSNGRILPSAPVGEEAGEGN